MEKKETFAEVLSLYSAQYFMLNEIDTRTQANYFSFIKGIKAFLDHENLTEILMENIDKPLMLKMNLYLLSRGGLTNAARTIQICKRASEWAMDQGIIKIDKIYSVKVKRSKQKEKVFLEDNELEKIVKAETSDKAMDIAKDLYIFQALTGMSFGDLQSFNYIKDDQGEWLYNKRKKNQKEYWIPLTEKLKGVDMIKGILNKYSFKLPKVHLKFYNPLIREIAKQVDINKYLTSHTGRKTFANERRNQGWSDDSIAYMMGHETTATTIKYYFNTSRKKLEMEVKQRQIA